MLFIAFLLDGQPLSFVGFVPLIYFRKDRPEKHIVYLLEP
jgi:hypothetical protein